MITAMSLAVLTPSPCNPKVRLGPSCRYHLIPLTGSIVTLEHRVGLRGWQPPGTGVRNRPPGGSDARTATFRRDMRA